MTNNTFLQIFLLINVFIIGGLVAIAARHAYAHFHPHPLEIAEKIHRQSPEAHLTQAMKEHLVEISEKHFQTVLNRSVVELQHSLKSTSARLDKQLNRLGADIITDEMKRYHNDLEQLRKQAEYVISNAQKDITLHNTDLKAQLEKRQVELQAKQDEDIKIVKQRMIQDLDTKLSDAIASFLTETLQHNVDLGAQNAYLTDMLEVHKAEIIKGIIDED